MQLPTCPSTLAGGLSDVLRVALDAEGALSGVSADPSFAGLILTKGIGIRSVSRASWKKWDRVRSSIENSVKSCPDCRQIHTTSEIRFIHSSASTGLSALSFISSWPARMMLNFPLSPRSHY